MTRHNLAGHISWLLSSEVTPPAGVHTTNTYTSTPPSIPASSGELGRAGRVAVEEDPVQQQQQVPDRGGFLRPAAPPPAPNLAARLQTRERGNGNSTAPGEESMGKLASASRSKRPALISQHQHQLATPVSTTTSSSLTQGYATFLRTHNNGMSMRRGFYFYLRTYTKCT